MYNLLEGKAKEKFDEWVYENTDYYSYEFSTILPSMQWGVLVDFFDENCIYVDVMTDWCSFEETGMKGASDVNGSNCVYGISSRHEAIKQALKLI